jgi:hypothetical protein
MMNWKPRVRSEETSDRQREQHRNQDGERPRHERIGNAIDRQHARGVGPHAEQRRLSKRDQPGIAEQKVDAQRRHAVDCDLRGKADVIGAEVGGQYDRDGEQKQEQYAASSEERHCQPRCAANRPVRLNSSTTAINT